jgi:hypothetical protein
MVDPPAPFETEADGVRLRLRDRELTIEGLPETFPVAIARGPAPFAVSLDSTIEEIGQSGAKLTFVLGSLGDDEAATIASVSALSRLPMPVLVLAGGRDHPGDLQAAFEAQGEPARHRVIHVSGLRRIRIGNSLSLVPVPGAVDGRYARDEEACGIGIDDFEEIASELGEAGEERRLLLAYAAPLGSAVSIALEGAEAGSSSLASFAQSIGATGGFVAWPEAHAGQVLGEAPNSYAVAPALAGPSLVRADGSRVPSHALLLSIGPRGIATPSHAP